MKAKSIHISRRSQKPILKATYLLFEEDELELDSDTPDEEFDEDDW